MATGPDNAHMKKAHRNYHTAYVKIKAGDRITSLSLPIWVYSVGARMAGEWCMAGATYATDASVDIPMMQTIQAGLIPFSTVKPYAGH